MKMIWTVNGNKYEAILSDRGIIVEFNRSKRRAIIYVWKGDKSAYSNVACSEVIPDNNILDNALVMYARL